MRLQGEGVTFRGERVRMDLHQHAFPKKRAAKKKRSSGYLRKGAISRKRGSRK